MEEFLPVKANNGCDWKKCTNECKSGTSSFIVPNRSGIGYCSKGQDGCTRARVYSNRNCGKGAGWGSSYTEKFKSSFGAESAVHEGKFYYPYKTSSGGWSG